MDSVTEIAGSTAGKLDLPGEGKVTVVARERSRQAAVKTLARLRPHL